MSQNNKIFLGIAVIIGFAVIFLIAYSNIAEENSTEPSTTSEETTSLASESSDMAPSSDETETSSPAPVDINEGEILLSESTYLTPGGSEPISVRIELAEDDTIQNIDVFLEGMDEHSVFHQTAFMNAFNNTDFEGKTLEESELGKVASASLTTSAFNKALVELNAQI